MKVLITGGAGFIGSNLVAAFLSSEAITEVHVLDNLSTGLEENLRPSFLHPKFHFVNASITDFNACMDAYYGKDAVCHQAALGSVPRSIASPGDTHQANVDGFFNMLNAAREQKVKRFVYASSSSVYGDADYSPKIESRTGEPLSPYAVSKKINEYYANVFARNYGMQTIGLRYFNVFGPNQRPDGPYAAVIPLFFKSALQNISPVINGDGSISRDFTFVENVVNANLKALFTENTQAFGQVFNIACGSTTSLNELWQAVKEVCGAAVDATHGPQRQGDILHSVANIEKAREQLQYNPSVLLHEGLLKTYPWYKNQLA